MPITTDFEVFSSLYHNRPAYVSDPMDLPDTAIMIENLNDEFDTLYYEKQELESKYNNLYDEHLNMYKLKHATKMLVVNMAIELNQERLTIDDQYIWEHEVEENVSDIQEQIWGIMEDDPIDLSDRKQELMDKFIK
jgi:hypothetical protein|tara:strand:+ start:278 stop:685 length:408 start_codon:yes stop_codon:yes gene_type:complete